MSNRLAKIEDWEALAREADYEPGKMAAYCPISLRQLERHFLLQFQQTPGQWIRHLRCRLAVEKIVQGYSNKAIATELKFANESHFCHEFKKEFSVSPQTYAPVFSTKSAMSPLSNNVAFEQSRVIEQPRPEP